MSTPIATSASPGITDCEEMPNSDKSLGAVSYTHLDVYKRQFLHRLISSSSSSQAGHVQRETSAAGLSSSVSR